MSASLILRTLLKVLLGVVYSEFHDADILQLQFRYLKVDKSRSSFTLLKFQMKDTFESVSHSFYWDDKQVFHISQTHHWIQNFDCLLSNRFLSNQYIWVLQKYFYSVVTPAPVLGKSSRWFNCHSWAAKSPVKGSVPAEWWAFLRPRRVGKKGLCSGLPTPPACFWALWKWGHSKQTIRPDEWIMMHMFTEWDFCSTFSVHSAKKRKTDKEAFQFIWLIFYLC